MEDQPFVHIPAFYLAIPFFFLLILFNWLGFLYKKRQVRKFPDIEPAGLGTAEGSLLGLMALLLSFAFGIAAAKYETRRQLLVEEANAIGTTILRCDLYPDSSRNLFRADLKNYLEARIEYYEVGDSQDQIDKVISRADSLSGLCWSRAASLSHNPAYTVPTLQMVPALNAMIDIVTTREAARKSIVPRLIMYILLTLTLVSSFLTGYGSKGHERRRVLVIAFALMTTLTLYLVIDLDRPRQGYINLSNAQLQMINLRSNFIESK
ncbi:MAG TPA: hypothetical protein DIC22_06320 [Chitinophagaceae bacterium]|nr:hypothetical protein [Chitinophagaceae bacterium]